ncbi:FAD-dependent oxidoreductase [Rathayibacter oskolensis]|uniref:FAD-dependent oxidoreductase n=1 Tax=Rathayibacter oskolensis TaxID=1891671 RepID=UPI00265E6F8B|nr:FAD-dependent oxidoreductase [Rathayibacter oskolensis]WKK73397.1 FAD-dependent oxidoreductase [Rathayibacter oskolensis]
MGGGNTGAQLVTVFNAFGSEVTLLDLAPRILTTSDASISEYVAAAFERQGVHVHTGIETVERLDRADDGAIDIRWREGGETRTERMDAVIMATGWPADVEDLGLGNAGIEVVRSAIPADQYFRTIVPHVFAVGDANGRDMLVQAAQFEAEAAAENAVLGANRRARSTSSRRADSRTRTTRASDSRSSRRASATPSASSPRCRSRCSTAR